MKLFALESSGTLAQSTADRLEVELARHEERDFEDGEHKYRITETVEGHACFVFAPLYGDSRLSVNDRLTRALFFCAALKDHGAAQVIPLAPYLCYQRKDRRTKPGDPITTRYLAQLFGAMGVDRMVALEVHNLQAFENAFRMPTIHLEGKEVFAPFLHGRGEIAKPTILSPDTGGVKRATGFRDALEEQGAEAPPVAFHEKERSGGKLSGTTLVGEVKGRHVLIYDDMITSGNTIVRAAQSCRKAGAEKVYAAATHGVFSPEAASVLNTDVVDGLFITDSIPGAAEKMGGVRKKVTVLETADLWARAIEALMQGGIQG